MPVDKEAGRLNPTTLYYGGMIILSLPILMFILVRVLWLIISYNNQPCNGQFPAYYTYIYIYMHIIYAEKQVTLLLEHPFGWGFPSHVWWHPGHVATMSRWLRCMHRVTRLFSWPFKKHRRGIGSLDRRALMWTSSSSGQNMYVYI